MEADVSSESENQGSGETPKPADETGVRQQQEHHSEPSHEPDQDSKNCPETAEPLELFDVETAGADERARVRKEALPKLVEKAGKLEATPPATETAQLKYEQALAKQGSALKALRETILRIVAAIECVLDEEVRKDLTDCFCKQVNTKEPAGDFDGPLPDLTCDPEADESVETLRTRVTDITRFIGETAKQFDTLVELPDKLEAWVGALTKRATELEAALCGPDGMEPMRAFVELLRLKRDAWLLRQKLTSGKEYGCRLRFLLVRLITLYTALACVSGKLKSKERAELLEQQREAKREAALVDLVLQCAKPPPGGGGPPDWGDIDHPCKECKDQTSKAPQTSSAPTAQSAA